MRRHSNQNQKGYTLLFAVITAALVLGVAVFILGLTRKQYELSVSARNSVNSFYAADSGIECAVNPTNWTSASGFSSTTGGTLTCGGENVVLAQVATPSIYPAGIVINDPASPIANAVRQWEGYVYLPSTAGPGAIKRCAKIIMTTGYNSSTNQPLTIIDSRGYNLCKTSPSVQEDTTNLATVERALRLLQAGIW